MTGSELAAIIGAIGAGFIAPFLAYMNEKRKLRNERGKNFDTIVQAAADKVEAILKSRISELEKEVESLRISEAKLKDLVYTMTVENVQKDARVVALTQELSELRQQLGKANRKGDLNGL